jgi:hypothetical protein
VGDVVGIRSPIGIEFLVVDSLESNALLLTSYYDSGLPARYLPSGTELFKVRVVLIGKDAQNEILRVVQLEPLTNLFQEVHSIPLEFPLQSILVQKLENPSDSSSWVNLGAQWTPARSGANLLRIHGTRQTLVHEMLEENSLLVALEL